MERLLLTSFLVVLAAGFAMANYPYSSEESEGVQSMSGYDEGQDQSVHVPRFYYSHHGHSGHGGGHSGHGGAHAGHGEGHTGHGGGHSGHGGGHSGHGGAHSGHGGAHSGHGGAHSGHDKVSRNQHSQLDRLFVSLLSHYHKETRPCEDESCDSPTNVKFTIVPRSFSLDFEDKDLISNYWLKFSYSDPRLSWDPEDFGGINDIRLPQSSIWVPDLALFNEAYGGQRAAWTNEHLAYVMSSGSVIIVPTGSTKTMCFFTDTDEQRCNITFGSWTYPEREVNVEIYEDDTSPSPPDCDLTVFKGVKNGDWKLSKCSVTRTSKVYPCCPDEHYVSITMELDFTGRSGEDSYRRRR